MPNSGVQNNSSVQQSQPISEQQQKPQNGNLAGLTVAKSAAPTDSPVAARATAQTSATNGFQERYPAGQGLQFSETKAASSIAYNGQRGDIYQFPDGKQWQVTDVREDANTGFRATVLRPVDPNDHRVVCAYAGTDPSSLNDLATDADQALGGIPPQYQQASNLAAELHQQYGSNLILTGHSLGGGLASYASMRNGGIPATAVNAAPLSPTAEIAGLIGNPRLTQNITQYAAQGEFVSNSPGFNPGQHVTVAAANNTPAWHNLIPGWGSTETLINSFRNHSLGNTAPEVPLPTKVN